MGSRTHWLACLLLLALASVLGLMRSQMPGWAFMWTVALLIFTGCKCWTWWRLWLASHGSSRKKYAVVSPPWLGAGYLLAWVGMDAPAFLHTGRPVPKPPATHWLFAATKAAFGAALIWGTVRLVPAGAEWLQGWVGLTGLAFLLHFGLFHLLALAWQRAGVDAQPIMRAPILANSVADFWGRRWNLAFHQLAHALAFRPLLRKFGAPSAAFAVFVLSGFVHELVISWPARGGYGGPTLYFALQGLAVLWERRWRPGGWSARLWTPTCVVGPVGLLFHPPFINQVILPFMKVIGAI